MNVLKKNMIKELKCLGLFVAILFVLTACGNKVSPFEASGRTREMVVVLPEQYQPDTLKAFCKNLFSRSIAMLPQAEPELDLSFTTDAHFSKIFKSYRNILVLDIDPKRYTTGMLKRAKDVWVNGQNVFTAQAPSVEVVEALLRKQEPKIEQLVVQRDIYMEVVDLSHTYSSKFAKGVQANIPGYTINIPNQLKWNKFEPNFAWASNMNEGNGGRVDIVVYTFPYKDKATFTEDYLLHKRDSVMKIQVLGEYPNSFMATEHRVRPVMTNIRVDGEYRAEIRSLWAMEGDMMGGPFVMHAMVSKDKQNVVVAECFVYAPQKEKRRLLLWGEAALYTLRPADSKINFNALFSTRQNHVKNAKTENED